MFEPINDMTLFAKPTPSGNLTFHSAEKIINVYYTAV